MGTPMGPWTRDSSRRPARNDPTVRFAFEGDIAATPTQKFTLMTSDGTPGTIELIPGPAFNLLEVNFQTDPQAEQNPRRQFHSA